VNWSATDDIQGALLAIDGVDWIATTSGRFQVFAEITARDTAELSSRLDLIRALPGVVLTETFPYLDLYHFEYRWIGPGMGSDRSRRNVPRVRLTELDRRVILELSADGRQSFRQIGRVIEVPEHQVRAAYAKLTATGALRVMAVLNPARLGFDTTALVGIRVDPSEGVRNVADALARERSVDHVVICTGRFDIIAEVWARSREHMAVILERDLGAIQGMARTEVFQYLRLQYSNENVWGVNRVPAAEVESDEQ
jgi:Lrp/AsnC family transcriptional regulator, regulator for asnA, asnC and gidA